MTYIYGGMKRVRFGQIYAHDLTFDGALDAIEGLVERGEGGFVVTPNVDHVVLAETHEGLRRAYAAAALSTVDGMPLVWLSKAMGHPLPEKISGSDLVRPLIARAAQRGWSVFFLGAPPGVAQTAADKLLAEFPGFRVAGVSCPPMGFERTADSLDAALAPVQYARPDIVLFALGCPKQELLMAECYQRLAPSVLLGIGASLEFIAGRLRRAPPWMSKMGAEWIYRISQDPRRLAHRYFIRDRAIVKIAVRMLRLPHAERASNDGPVFMAPE